MPAPPDAAKPRLWRRLRHADRACALRSSFAAVVCALAHGALAQLGERLLCKHQVIGSIPISSTTFAGISSLMKTRDPLSLAAVFGASGSSLTL